MRSRTASANWYRGKAWSSAPPRVEEVGGGPSGDDEVVEAQLGRQTVALVELEDAVVPPATRDAGSPEGHVALALEDVPHRVTDVGGVQAGGGDLVEERLEGVEVVAVDQW